MNWSGQRVVILGVARQGTALARYLIARGAQVTLSDLKRAEQLDLEPLAGLPVRFVLGEHPLALLEGCDLLCLSGGVPTDLPIVQEARRRGIPLSNDAQIFMDACPAAVIGITGSAGKTTTTALVGEMLKADDAGRAVWVGGNIGNPLISDLDRIQPGDRVVMELSSFQLELMRRSPHIACITNITPNHLDRHGTMEAYIAAKRRILDFQSLGDWRVLSADNPVTAALGGEGANTLWFSMRGRPGEDGAWLDEAGTLRVRLAGASSPELQSAEGAAICHRREVLLMGDHNIANILAAAVLCAAAGASVDAMRQVATAFRGVPHRLQLIADHNGVRWYDDSIATAPERLVAALKCFDQPVILLCGGRDKHLPWEDAAREMLARCKAIILFGEMGPLVADHLARQQGAAGGAEWMVTHDLREAVWEAHNRAQPGDAVLLSPGGTSYDAFKDFAERGARFREWVNDVTSKAEGQIS
jgi:UDP-N-acetylmuramoylalanine--D-glutamate ligase